MAGRPLYNLPNATTVESGDKFLIQQGVSSKQVDGEVLAALYKDHATSYNKNPADGSAHNADDIGKDGGGSVQDVLDNIYRYDRIEIDTVYNMIIDTSLLSGDRVRLANNDSFIISATKPSNYQNKNIYTLDSGLFAIRDLSYLAERNIDYYDDGAFDYEFLSSFNQIGRSNILLIGDSITEAVGASSPILGYAERLSRAIANTGVTYQNPVFINMGHAFSRPGWVTDGTIATGGIVDDRLILTVGQSITLTGVSGRYFGVFYDGSLSSGSFQVNRNGVYANDHVVISALGIQNSFSDSSIGYSTDGSDEVRIIVTSGTVVVTGVFALEQADNSPLLFVIPKSGWTLENFNDSNKIAELEYYADFNATANPLLILNIGTNTLYSTTASQTPSDYLATLDGFFDKLQLQPRLSNSKKLLSVPPQGGEVTKPIIETGFIYQNYVDSIVDHSKRFLKCGIIRHDSQAYSYGDEIHPDDKGHSMMARTICARLGIVPNFGLKNIHREADRASFQMGEFTYQNNWGGLGANPNSHLKIHRDGNVIHLSGLVAPNGSPNGILAIVEKSFRANVDRYFFVRSSTGAVVTANFESANGRITLGSFVDAWYSFDGVSLVVNPNGNG